MRLKKRVWQTNVFITEMSWLGNDALMKLCLYFILYQKYSASDLEIGRTQLKFKKLLLLKFWQLQFVVNLEHRNI